MCGRAIDPESVWRHHFPRKAAPVDLMALGSELGNDVVAAAIIELAAADRRTDFILDDALTFRGFVKARAQQTILRRTA